MAISPGNFTSTIDTGLPASPQTEEGTVGEDLQVSFNAIQILQAELDKVLARLAAAGIP